MSTTTVILQQAFGPYVSAGIQLIVVFIFVLIPIFAMRTFWSNWVAYVRGAFFAKQKYVLLELRIPKGLAKSPLAMEVFITALHQGGGEGNWYDKYWKGQVRLWSSLEIVSIEGTVRFFIWSRAAYRDLIETQLYGQFPDIEILEAEDYTKAIPFDPLKLQYWGCEFKKTAASHLPIKTYTDFGLHEDPKEEYKIDPITPIIEYLGSLRRGEQTWIQIVIRAHKKEWTKPGTWFEKVDWKHAANEDIKKRTHRDKKDDPARGNPQKEVLTKGEKAAVDAIEQNLSKVPFDCGIRAVYIAKSDAFRSSSIWGVLGAFRQFNHSHLNGLVPTNGTSFDYPWQDLTGKKLIRKKKKMFERFKYRSFFYDEYIPVGYGGPSFVMTTEELASVYHFPGDVSKTPTLTRAIAKKVEPPANLPI